MNAALRIPLSLAPGAVLRIDRGTRVALRAASGLVWITERSDPRDHVLGAGDRVVLGSGGRALVAAARPSRIVLEIPRHLADVPRLELAEREGEPGRALALSMPSPARRLPWLHRVRRRLAAFMPRSRTEVLVESALGVRARVRRAETMWLTHCTPSPERPLPTCR